MQHSGVFRLPEWTISSFHANFSIIYWSWQSISNQVNVLHHFNPDKHVPHSKNEGNKAPATYTPLHRCEILQQQGYLFIPLNTRWGNVGKEWAGPPLILQSFSHSSNSLWPPPYCTFQLLTSRWSKWYFKIFSYTKQQSSFSNLVSSKDPETAAHWTSS